MALVLFENTSQHVAKITLNDPDNLNAMGEEMAAEFVALTARLGAEKVKPRALIMTGAGRAFSAGGNLDMLERKTQLAGEENRQLRLKFYHSFLGILKLGVPMIAAINGHAIGAGLCIACACDIRLAARGAKLGVTFTKLGLHPGMGGTYFLPRLVGAAMASELILTGRVIEAEEAQRIGLVSRVTGTEDILSQADALAQEIAACGPESVRQVLESLRVPASGLQQALEREALCQSINYASAEFKEGVRAGKEKRKPEF
jgi:enoyl-CoA hydratase